MFLAVMTIIVILLLAFLIDGGRDRSAKLGAVAMAVAALIWSIYRATALHDTHWMFIRHLGAGWIIWFVLMAAAVTVAAVFRRTKLAGYVAWAALGLAVLLPVFDVFSSEFWLGWIHSRLGVMVIVVAGLVLAALYLRGAFGSLAAFIALGLAGVMLLVWVVGAIVISTTASDPPRSGSLTPADPSTTPSPSASASASPTPTQGPTSASPSASATAVVPSQRLVTTQSIVNWQDLKSAASSDFEAVVDKSKPTQGTLGEAKTWGSPVADTRLVVIFASKAQISDDKARTLAGVGSSTLVTRASACYTPYQQTQVCPSGNRRVMLTLAASIKDNKGYAAVNTWGVAAVKLSDSRVAYWPVTYEER